jgi:hypothetical protein
MIMYDRFDIQGIVLSHLPQVKPREVGRYGRTIDLMRILLLCCFHVHFTLLKKPGS